MHRVYCFILYPSQWNDVPLLNQRIDKLNWVVWLVWALILPLVSTVGRLYTKVTVNRGCLFLATFVIPDIFISFVDPNNKFNNCYVKIFVISLHVSPE